MRYVVDASVALKWFFQSEPDEDHLDQAIALLRASCELDVEFIQPPQFIAEVTAVLARKKPEMAEADLRDLLALHQLRPAKAAVASHQGGRKVCETQRETPRSFRRRGVGLAMLSPAGLVNKL